MLYSSRSFGYNGFNGKSLLKAAAQAGGRWIFLDLMFSFATHFSGKMGGFFICDRLAADPPDFNFAIISSWFAVAIEQSADYSFMHIKGFLYVIENYYD
ncbi:hypothetical protein HSX37_17540|nr:hypothetical protein [Dendrosporobacter quercicolus]NSL49822.1 hypothetical protein [Dendrosporobacter quercicolus DSM 1736]